jgi:hypothetical protein
MAHFAELDSNNIVLRTVVACNQDIANNGGEQSTQAAKYFESVIPLSSNGVKWVQTSYNSNFRKKFAGKGDYYDEQKDIFYYKDSPYSSWTLDSNFDWQAPIQKPSITTSPLNGENLIISWNESILKWIAFAYDNQNNKVNFEWNLNTQNWDQV